MNAVAAMPVNQVSDHSPILVTMEATAIQRQQVPVQEPDAVDPRSLPQTTIRKVIKHCLENGVFDTTPFIDQRPMIAYIPQEAIASYLLIINFVN